MSNNVRCSLPDIDPVSILSRARDAWKRIMEFQCWSKGDSLIVKRDRMSDERSKRDWQCIIDVNEFFDGPDRLCRCGHPRSEHVIADIMHDAYCSKCIGQTGYHEFKEESIQTPQPSVLDEARYDEAAQSTLERLVSDEPNRRKAIISKFDEDHGKATASVKACPRCGYELTPFKGGKYAWWCHNCHIPTDDPAPATPSLADASTIIHTMAAKGVEATAAPLPWVCSNCGSTEVYHLTQRARGLPDAWVCHECKYEMPTEPARKSPNDG